MFPPSFEILRSLSKRLKSHALWLFMALIFNISAVDLLFPLIVSKFSCIVSFFLWISQLWINNGLSYLLNLSYQCCSMCQNNVQTITSACAATETDRTQPTFVELLILVDRL